MHNLRPSDTIWAGAARPRSAADAARPRRRGDRMSAFSAAQAAVWPRTEAPQPASEEDTVAEPKFLLPVVVLP